MIREYNLSFFPSSVCLLLFRSVQKNAILEFFCKPCEGTIPCDYFSSCLPLLLNISSSFIFVKPKNMCTFTTAMYANPDSR